MHPPRRHFVPLSQFESPHLGQSLRVCRAYLGYILGNFWQYLWHIYKKAIVQLAFFVRQIVPSDKMSHFLPGDKMSQLMHLCTGKLWKVVRTFCRLSHFVNLKANTLGKVCAFSEHVLDIYCLLTEKYPPKYAQYWPFSLATNCPNSLFHWRQNVPTTFHNFHVHKCISWDILSPGRKWDILSPWDNLSPEKCQ